MGIQIFDIRHLAKRFAESFRRQTNENEESSIQRSSTELSWDKCRQRARHRRRTAFEEWGLLRHPWYQSSKRLRSITDPRFLLKFILCRFGIIETIMTYKLGYFARDLMAGLTMSFFHLAQGLAYGQLAGLSGANGLYVSLYEPIFYAVFGTSRHISIGTASTLALLTERTTKRMYNELPPDVRVNMTEPERFHFYQQVAMTVTLLSGIVMVFVAVLHIGSIAIFITKPVFSAFACAAAFLVFTNQFPKALGFKMPEYSGFGIFFREWAYILIHLGETHLPTLGVTALCLTCLWTGKLLNRVFIRYIKISLPLEAICIAITCAIGSQTSFFRKYNITEIGPIPHGLPAPLVPNLLHCWRSLSGDVFTAVLITLCTNLVTIIALSDAYHHEISIHQDVLAYGITNILSSFFECFPGCASLSRIAVATCNYQKSQFTYIVSSMLLILMIYTVTPYLSKLPSAVLASIVIYDIVERMARVRQVLDHWTVNFTEGLVYLETFIVVLVFDLYKGLLCAAVISAVINTLLLIKPKFKRIGVLPEGGFVDISAHPEARELAGIKMVRMQAPLLCYNTRYFKRRLLRDLGFATGPRSPGIAKLLDMIFKSDMEETSRTSHLETSPGTNTRMVVIDCSSMTSIDSHGISLLKEIKEMLQQNHGTELGFARVNESVCASIDAEGSYDELLKGHMFYELRQLETQKEETDVTVEDF